MLNDIKNKNDIFNVSKKFFQALFPVKIDKEASCFNLLQMMKRPMLPIVLGDDTLRREVQRAFFAVVKEVVQGLDDEKKPHFLKIALSYLSQIQLEDGDEISWDGKVYRIERIPLLSAKDDKSIQTKYHSSSWAVDSLDRVYAYALHPKSDGRAMLVMPSTMAPMFKGWWSTVWADIMPFVNVGQPLFHRDHLSTFFNALVAKKIDVIGASMGGGLTQLLVNSEFAKHINAVTLFNAPGFHRMTDVRSFENSCQSNQIDVSVYANKGCPVHALGLMPNPSKRISYYDLSLKSDLLSSIRHSHLRHIINYAGIQGCQITKQNKSRKHAMNTKSRYFLTGFVLWFLRIVLFPLSCLLALGVHGYRHPAISMPCLFVLGCGVIGGLAYRYHDAICRACHTFSQHIVKPYLAWAKTHAVSVMRITSLVITSVCLLIMLACFVIDHRLRMRKIAVKKADGLWRTIKREISFSYIPPVGCPHEVSMREQPVSFLTLRV